MTYMQIMMYLSFHTSTHAKCILAGEHAVLRGSPAIIFPIKSKSLNLSYSSEYDGLQADSNSPYAESLLTLFLGMLQNSVALLKKPPVLTGKFLLKNNIIY